MSNTHRRVILKSRPEGEPTSDNFELVEGELPSPGDGRLLARTIYLSLDPYMRGRISEARSYAKPVEVGDLMVGGAVSQVIESNNPKFAEGDIIFGYSGWQSHVETSGKGFRKVDPQSAPISTALGILGMPGMTAYTGLKNIGQPKEGETLVVAAASGAVGATVGQIGRIHGCRVVGIAGGPEKCEFVTSELGFDACIDHRSDDLADQLAKACPDGVDVYWENVGGPIFEAVLPLFNPFARVPVCGLIAQYNMTELPEGPNKIPLLLRSTLTNRLRIQGFIVWDYAEQEQEFYETMSGWIRDGKVKYREDFIDGLEAAPEGFIGLLKGKNFGKLVVRVSDDPTQ